MDTNKKRIGCLGWIGRVLLAIVGLLVITGLVGAAVRANLRARYPPSGQLVDVGGYRMHISCQGSGSPTVIVEAGQGGFGSVYQNIQAELGRETRVCTYDRAGLGWSDLGKKPRSAQVVVEELHTLLNNAEVEGPYVLVGHSLGGLFSLLYAHTYPQDTVGVVLLDSPHMDRFTRAPEKEINNLKSVVRMLPMYYNVMMVVTLTGIPSLLPPPSIAVDGFPPEVAEVNGAVVKSSIRILRGMGAELSALEAYYQQVQAANINSLGDIPVIAITHSRPEGYMNMTPEEIEASEKMWRQFQDEFAALSTQGQVILAENSGHNIHLERPDLVYRSIREVLQTARAQTAP